MKLHQRLLLTALVVLVLAVSPTAQLYAQPYPPLYTVERTYYCDYFETWCAFETTQCVWPYEWWGEGDPSCGIYRTVWVENCRGSIHNFSCQEKVNGEWVEIDCPS